MFALNALLKTTLGKKTSNMAKSYVFKKTIPENQNTGVIMHSGEALVAGLILACIGVAVTTEISEVLVEALL